MNLEEEDTKSGKTSNGTPVIVEGDYARIAGKNILVRACCPDEEAGLWETDALIPSPSQYRDFVFDAVDEKDLIPLEETSGFSSIPANRAPEYFHFEFSVWPIPRFDLKLWSNPENEKLSLELIDVSPETTGLPKGLAGIDIDQSEPSLQRLLGFISSHSWELSYCEAVLDGYGWSMDAVIGEVRYTTSGMNAMPKQLEDLPKYLDDLLATALGEELAKHHQCPNIKEYADW